MTRGEAVGRVFSTQQRTEHEHLIKQGLAGTAPEEHSAQTPGQSSCTHLPEQSRAHTHGQR